MFLMLYRADLNECQQERRLAKTKRDQPVQPHVVATQIGDLPQTSCTIAGITAFILI